MWQLQRCDAAAYAGDDLEALFWLPRTLKAGANWQRALLLLGDMRRSNKIFFVSLTHQLPLRPLCITATVHV